MVTSNANTATPDDICAGLPAEDGFEAAPCSEPVAPPVEWFGRAIKFNLCSIHDAERVRRNEIREDRRRAAEQTKARRAQMLRPEYGFAPAFAERRKTLDTVKLLSPNHRRAIDAMRALTQWKRGDGCTRNLRLAGAAGIGKSHIAEAGAVLFCDTQGGDVPRARIYNVRQLGIDLVAGNSSSASVPVDTIVERCKTARLLVLDDLGATRITRYVLDHLYLIVDHRARFEMLTVTTTNYGKVADLATRLIPSDGGDVQDAHRVIDRVLELCPVAIELYGESQRPTINREVSECR